MRPPCHDPAEPLATFFGAPEPGPRGAECVRFEFASAGDRVSGRLLLPARSAEGSADPAPLVLVGHGRGGSKDAPYIDAVAAPWAERGAAVAAIDFPLHGERQSAKLSERIFETMRSAHEPEGLETSLRVQFARQASLDLARAVAALRTHPRVDAARLTYAGFSMGTMLGAAFCADEPAVRAAALAIGGAAFDASDADPARHIARFHPRPLLFVQAERDETIPRARAEALHAAAREPKQVLWFDCGHADLPGHALKAMWSFLAPHLDLA